MDQNVYQEKAEKASPRDWVGSKFEEAERLSALPPEGRDMYRRLSVLRARLARDAGVPAYQVLSNKLLLSLAELRPKDEAALAAIDGLGVTRLKAYGAEVLAVLRSAQPLGITSQLGVT